MCILAIKPKGHQLTEVNEERLRIGAVKNPDGYGYYAYNTSTREEEVFHTFSPREFVDRVVDRGTPEWVLVYHARIKTAGDESIDNLHPFAIKDGWYVFQNGTVTGMDKDKKWSDTAILAKLTSKFSKHTATSYAAFSTMLTLMESARFVFIRKDKYFIANEDVGTWEDGVWYSNDRVFKEPVFVYGTLKDGGVNDTYVWGNVRRHKARTYEKRPLLADGLPKMFNDIGGHQVKGELVFVSQKNVEHMDGLEGHPKFYKRMYDIVQLENMDLEIEAHCYFYQNEEELKDESNEYVEEYKIPSYKSYRTGGVGYGKVRRMNQTYNAFDRGYSYSYHGYWDDHDDYEGDVYDARTDTGFTDNKQELIRLYKGEYKGYALSKNELIQLYVNNVNQSYLQKQMTKDQYMTALGITTNFEDKPIEDLAKAMGYASKDYIIITK